MQKKSIIGGILRWATLGAFMAAAFVFAASTFFGAVGFVYGASILLGAGIAGAFGAVKTMAQNAAQERTEQMARAPARSTAAGMQVSAPALVQAVDLSRDAGSFVAREEARRAATPQQKAL